MSPETVNTVYVHERIWEQHPDAPSDSSSENTNGTGVKADDTTVWTDKSKSKIANTDFHNGETVFTNRKNELAKKYTNADGNRVCEIYVNGKMVKASEFTEGGTINRAYDAEGHSKTSFIPAGTTATKSKAKEKSSSVDGKDDGSISFGQKCKALGKGALRSVTSLFTDENGKFSWGQTAKTVGIGLLAVAAVIAAPVVGTVLVAAGVAYGAYKGIKGGIKASEATTDKQASEAWTDIGDGAGTVGLSLLGAKASLKKGGFSTTRTVVRNGQAVTKEIGVLRAGARCIAKAPESLKGTYKATKNPKAVLQNLKESNPFNKTSKVNNKPVEVVEEGSYKTLEDGVMEKGVEYKIPQGCKPELTLNNGEIANFKKPSKAFSAKLAKLEEVNADGSKKYQAVGYKNLTISKKDGHLFVKDASTATETVKIANAPKIESKGFLPNKAALKKGDVYEINPEANTKFVLPKNKTLDVQNLPKVKALKEGETVTIGRGDLEAGKFSGIKEVHLVVSKRNGKLYISSNGDTGVVSIPKTASTSSTATSPKTVAETDGQTVIDFETPVNVEKPVTEAVKPETSTPTISAASKVEADGQTVIDFENPVNVEKPVTNTVKPETSTPKSSFKYNKEINKSIMSKDKDLIEMINGYKKELGNKKTRTVALSELKALYLDCTEASQKGEVVFAKLDKTENAYYLDMMKSLIDKYDVK